MQTFLKKRTLYKIVEEIGAFLTFLGKASKAIFVPLIDRKLVFQHMEFIGVRSIGIIILAAIMIGAVFAIPVLGISAVMIRRFGHYFLAIRNKTTKSIKEEIQSSGQN